MKGILIWVLCITTLLTTHHCPAQKAIKDSEAVYDFTPRQLVQFEDNFGEDSLKLSPSRWTLVKNNGVKIYTEIGKYTVKKIGNDFALEAQPGKNPITLRPIVQAYDFLVDSFTVEYDFLLGSNDAEVTLSFEFDKKWRALLQCFSISYSNGWYNLTNEGWIPTDIANSPQYKNIASLQMPNDGKQFHHFALSFNKGELKCYLDQFRVMVVPDTKYKPLNLMLQFEGLVQIKNVRLATGNENSSLSKLLSEKKLITHAILFDVNKSTIRPVSLSFLMQLAGILNRYHDLKLEIDGYTDNDGNPIANELLSQQRAKEIKQQLITYGVDGNRLITKGYGATKPLQPNNSPENKANNRRVEFIIK